MKKISFKTTSFILVLILCFTAFPAFSPAKYEANAETLPSAVDLRTTKHLPPIDNQGAVGCCASMAITYMQFTNAYSRYLHSIDPNSSFNPSSGAHQYLFSPRFTYNLAGAGTAWVYEVLKDQGTVLKTMSNFQYDSYGGAMENTMAKDLATIDGYWLEAQNYRINNYDQVWLSNETYQFKMTTSEAGLALINRIKSALNEGNVVVTGGYPSRWKYTTISGKGSYGKTGEQTICYSTGTDAGGHQVSIVGYDDEITCKVNGVTLKGAFLVANSWGTGWQNKGYTWMMYDALNETSPYSALNVSGRTWTMDQMCFLDWKTDLSINTEELVASLSLTTKNRDGLNITLTATGLDGSTLEYTPYIFDMEWARPYKDVNFYGGTTAAKGTLSFNYNKLIAMIPQGKTVADYRFGVTVRTDNGHTATLHSVKLTDKNGTVLFADNTESSIPSGGSCQKALGDLKILTCDLPKGVSLLPVSGSTYTKTKETYQFSLQTAAGYDTSKAQVSANGKILCPVNGVYTVTFEEDTLLKVAGVLPTVKTINIGHYGFEYWSGNDACVCILSIAKSDIEADSYKQSALDNNSYRYSFRITVNGVTYEFVPSSFYEFSASTLYRLPVANQGWIPAKGNYTLSVEVCYDGVPVYRDNEVVATNKVEMYSTNGLSAHTHNYSGEILPVTYSNCTHKGEGYRLCAVKNCRAVLKVTTDLLSDVHHYEGKETLLQNATSKELGTKMITCAHCGHAHTFSFSAPPCDANGDGVVTISDVTVMLDFLSGKTTLESISCDADANGDGRHSISDITRMLYVLCRN